MKSIGLLLAVLLGQVPAQASSELVDAYDAKVCKERLNTVLKNKRVKVTVGQETYKIAAKALAHYRDNITQGGVYISSAVAYQMPDNKTAGYSVYITDGGDESTVAYYFDRNNKLIYGKWHNQSPEEYWFCEK